jgi:copper chaperone NosL
VIPRTSLSLGVLLLLSCGSGEAPPATLDTANETCSFCRMPVSDPRLAAQIAAPGEEPAFFDDIGCLRDFLRGRRSSPGAIAYVVDRRTGSWVRSADAVYSRCPSIETPMGSHLVAHADASSRDGDAAISGCAPITAKEVFGAAPPNGRQKGG